MEQNERKVNINLTDYPKLINKKILRKISLRKHPMANMPFFSKEKEPDKLKEEEIIESRYKSLIDNYSNTYSVNKDNVTEIQIMLNSSFNVMNVLNLEKDHRPKLINLVEIIMRDEYNIGKDEILFDLEIVDIGECELPNEINVTKKIDDEFEQSKDSDVLKKRTINALSQGAALSSHYIFHMYKDEFEFIRSGLTEIYQKALIANDLIYFILDDNQLQSDLEGGGSNSNAGYCKINYDGEIPVLEAKAINAPILIHEITKGLITFFSTPGIQNMKQETIDETDYVMAELWDIRFGVTIWQQFHSIINEKDYDIKKIILVELFKMESEYFVKEFMYNVFNKPELAKKELDSIVRKIRKDILEYDFLKDSDDFDISKLF